MCAAQPALSNFVPATDVSVAKRAGSKSRLSDGSSGGGVSHLGPSVGATCMQ